MSIEQHGVNRVQFTLQHAVCSMQSTGAVYSMQSTGVLYNPGKSEKVQNVPKIHCYRITKNWPVT